MIQQLLVEEMPREKLIKYGKESLTQVELLALLIRTGTKDKNVLELSREIISSFSAQELLNASYERFMQIKGISTAKACELVALFELSKQIHNKCISNSTVFTASRDIFKYVKNSFKGKSKEELRVLFLNTKHKLIKDEVLAKGGIQHVFIQPREILSRALELHASSIVLVHNHPSGDCTPSSQDIQFTTQVIDACRVLGINCIDHIIVGNNTYFSLFDEESVKF